ncbi:MAG: SDR family NAD(P)-dependent oxidoreductase [Solirubrobacteraceae bacterium]
MTVDYAAHSPQVEAIGEELRAACMSISPQSGEIPFYSSVIGDRLDGLQLDAEYWYRNLRETVRFEQATRALLGNGLRTFIEVSPAPALAAGTLETAELHFDGEQDGGESSEEYYSSAADVRVHGSLRRGDGGPRRFLTSLAEAWAAGVEVDWRALFGGSGKTVRLPTYPFQRERYWLEPSEAVGHSHGGASHATSLEGEFWDAVETEDLGGLAGDLGLEGELERSSLELVLPALSAWQRRRRAESLTADWRYRIGWKRIHESRASLSGNWMVLLPASLGKDLWVDSVLEALRAQGAHVTRIEVDVDTMFDRDMVAERLRDALVVQRESGLSSQRPDLGTEGHDRISQEQSLAPEATVGGVLSLLSLEEAPNARWDAVPSGLAGTLALVQALEDMAVEAPLWMATRGAVSVERSDLLQSPTQGMTWGLGRVIGLELSKRRGGLLDLPATLDASAQGSLCSALSGVGAEDQLAVRSNGLYVRRLLRAPASPAASTSPWQPRGTVLVTGGLGGLGAHVARWLAGAGAEHLVLASRRGPAAEGATELKSELEQLGAKVSVVGCDVSDRRQLADLLETLPAEYPLDAVIHAAGVQGSEALATTSVEKLQETLASKAQAALHLHELTQEMKLSAFVMFSSMAATMGSASQGGYAAANAFLDALAEYRQGCGLSATSVAWGMWAGAGMGADSAATEELRRRGILSIEPERAIGALQQALDLNETCLTVTRVDWNHYAPNYAFAGPRPLIEDLPEVREAFAAAQAGLDQQPAGDALASRLSGLSKRERERVVLTLVRGEAAGALGHTELEAIGPQRAFKELGFDSLTAVEMRRRLQVATGLRLAATVVFDYPTPILLAGHLLREATGASEETPAARPSAARTQEPIAIVAMSCRYPGGVRSPEDLWEIAHSGVDAIGGFPTDRGWDLESLYDPDPDRHGTSYTREGGFVPDIGEFDAGFFGISPREALAMDPQQRILLEVCWEAFERAGIDPLSLRGTDTGIFAGINPTRYGLDLPGELEGYQVTAGAGSAISGRVAYTFGLEGQAVSVDTACSSSLVALHLACGALRGGECDLALAGGVAVISTPDGFVAFSRQRGLALDGRCKSFADAADGTGWSEGAGVLLLERLSDAQRSGHPILALVRGSAINQDGASNGLTAPSGLAQQRVIRQALANAGLSSNQVQAVEGHGTGTTLGDPIEAQALLATYGQQRRADNPLWLGSIKSNIGHPQAAGGAAGVIKMVMALRHETLPKTLHVDEPSRQVDWQSGAVELLREGRAWDSFDEPRRAGVSSFGASGTNAHVIIEQAPLQAPPASVGGKGDDSDEQAVTGRLADIGVVPWVVSGKGEQALRQQARQLLAHVEQEQHVTPADVGLSLAAGRSALDHRAVIVGSSRESLLASLGSLARADLDAGVTEGAAYGVDVATAFLFTGQGAQRVGMGRELYERFSVFRESLDEACGYLDELLECSLREVMFGEDSGLSADDGESAAGKSRLDDTMFAQTGLFALELSLFRLLEDLGLRPDYLLGHSIGELTAAHVAGVLTLQDACALVAARGRLMGALPEGGAMVSIQASEDEALESLVAFQQRASLAAVNGPGAVVLSGDEQAILELADLWSSRGRKTKRLRVSHAFHSHRMEDMLVEYAEVANRLTFAAPHIPIVSNLTGGQMLAEQACDPAYWVRQVREPVRFYEGVRWLIGQGTSCLLELGPDGVLSAMSLECLQGIAIPGGESARGQESAHSQDAVTATSALRGARPEVNALLSALAETWVHGAAVDWEKAFDGVDAHRLQLPTYAFQRQRYWLGGVRLRSEGHTSTAPTMNHPILESSVALADGRGWLFTGELSLDSQPWVADHVVMGVVLVPGTTFVDLALTVAEEVGCDLLAELVMEVPLVLTGRERVQLQVSVTESDEAGGRNVEIYSRLLESSQDGSPDAGEWTRHASGVLAQSVDGGSRNGAALDASSVEGAWPPEGAEPLDVEAVYDFATGVGVDYGPAFLTVNTLWQDADRLFAEARLPEHELARARRFHIHPALLDAALHSIAVYSYGSEQMQIPFEWRDVRVRKTAATALRVSISPAQSGGISLTMMDDLGAPLASVGSLVVRPVTSAQLGSAADRGQSSLSHVDWVDLAIDRAPSSFSGALVGEQDERLSVPLLSANGSLEVYEDMHSLGIALEGGATIPEIAVVACMSDSPVKDAHSLTNGHVSDRHPSKALHDGMAERMRDATHLALDLIQAWLSDPRLSTSRLAFVTRNAVAVTPEESVDGLAQAGIWGLVRAAATESPRRLLLVDLDDDQSSWRILPQALGAAAMLDEPQLAIRKGSALAPRLAPVDRKDSQGIPTHELAIDARSFDPNGTVLITGGTGALGSLLARHLVTNHEVRHLLLASRSGRDGQGALELASELERLGAEVNIEVCDVAERDQLQELLATVADEHPLCAVVHVAGVVEDGVVGSLTVEQVDRVLAPKVSGAWHLHRLTEDLDLSAFIMFSSASGVLGGMGQANYAAANAFLDALAARRRAEGLAGMSLAWGPWETTDGMAGGLGDTDRVRMARSGVASMSDAEALDLFDFAHGREESLLVAAHLDLQVLSAWAATDAPPSMLRGLARPATRHMKGVESGALIKRLAATPRYEHARILLDAVCTHTAIVLGHSSSDAIEAKQPFKDLGFDSLAAVELRNRLNKTLEISLPATLIFDYPTPKALVDYLLENVAPDGEPSASALDAELDKLERLLATAVSDEGSRSKVTGRLQAILSGLSESGNSGKGSAVAEKMRSATAEEVLDFIDREMRPR